MYDALAAVYDVSGQSRFSLKMIGYLLEILALRRKKPVRIADLACGTGAAAVALARRKFLVAGLDGSSAMLDRGRARAARWKVNVAWHQADLANLPAQAGSLLPEAAGGFDLVTCLYDSLNHLTEPVDLRRALVGARRLLAPGGLFFFDVNTPHAYRSVWGDSHDSYLGPHHARFWKSRYDHATGLAQLDATYFVPEGEQWKRVDLTHVARGYDDTFVRAALAEAGFELLEAYEALTFQPVSGETYRAAYLASA